jgi:Tat protein translocase TatB subunit
MELVVIALVALLVLGPKRLPDAMRQAGKAVAEMKRWSSQVTTQVHSAFEGEPEPPVAATTGEAAK